MVKERQKTESIARQPTQGMVKEILQTMGMAPDGNLDLQKHLHVLSLFSSLKYINV